MTGIRKSGPEPPASRTGPTSFFLGTLLLGMIISGGRRKARPSVALGAAGTPVAQTARGAAACGREGRRLHETAGRTTSLNRLSLASI